VRAPSEKGIFMDRFATDVENTIAACIRCARGAEICGYLLQDDSGTQSFLAIENRLASRDGVFASALDIDRAKRLIRGRGLKTLAWIHSHDGGTSLSDVDRQGLAESDIPWAVVCLTKGKLQMSWYAARDMGARSVDAWTPAEG
jgi:proteasome lid subunit RPN8/RPN11